MRILAFTKPILSHSSITFMRPFAYNRHYYSKIAMQHQCKYMPMAGNYKNIFRFSSKKINNGQSNQQNTNMKKSDPLFDHQQSQNQKQRAQSNTQNTAQTQLQEVSQEQKLINIYLGLNENHSFKKQLIVAQNDYRKNLTKLKEAILYEDLLKKQLNIDIYDTQGKPYMHHIIKFFIAIVALIGTFYCLRLAINQNKKIQVIIDKTLQGKIYMAIFGAMCAFVFANRLISHLRMTNRYVEKITYNTQNQKFTFVRRNFYGRKYQQEVNRYKILYTENPQLNKKGTNYFNIENHQQYNIGYTFAWKKQDLFSHLISQRIKK